MKTIISLIVLSALLACGSEEEIFSEENDRNECSIPAAVRNLTGLDGCGFVLELSDGTILEALTMIECGPPPSLLMTVHDPLEGFKVEGLNVLIDYEDYEGGSTCMAGRVVRINCITKVSSTT